MAFVKLELPPGLLRRGTEYQSQGRWYDQNLMRWHEGSMGPIDGWIARTSTPITGKGRALLTWIDNSGTRYIAVGTEQKLYAGTQSATALSDITPVGFTAGDADATSGGGYGIGLYGAGAYGTPRIDSTSVQDASVWSLDTFGEDLVACMAEDGVVYQWELDVNTAAAAVSGAPAGDAIVVTPERFLFVLGAGGNKRKVQWPDQATLTTWTPSATNQAGDYELATQGRLMLGRRLRNITLLWTDLDVHVATYVGLPYVYRIERQGENCGAVSRGAVTMADARAFWMGPGDFFTYDGFVRPLNCEIHEAVFSDINLTQRSKISAYLQSKYSEVWWFYCSAASTEVDRIAVYNYHEDHWNLHDMSEWPRLSAVDRGIFQNPIMVGADGLLYDHEVGSLYDGVVPYAKSGPFELGDGDRIVRARQLIPDEKTQGDVEVTFFTRNSPNGTESTHGPYSMADFVPVRFAGRQASIKVSGAVAAAWRWGVPRVDVTTGGRR